MEKVKITTSKTIIKRSHLMNTESTCVDCGNLFKVSIDEIGRFKDKKIPLPTRCKSCRRYKLIEIKLKKITKLLFKILENTNKNYEYKLQKKQSKGNFTQTQTGE